MQSVHSDMSLLQIIECVKCQSYPVYCFVIIAENRLAGLLDQLREPLLFREPHSANRFWFCINFLKPTGHYMHQQFNI